MSTIHAHVARIPDELVAALLRLAGETGVSLSSVLLAAHATVLAALSGERTVATGYVVMNGRHPLPCRMSTEPRSWRAMLREAYRAEQEVQSRARASAGPGREPGLTGPWLETVFDPTAS